MLNESEIHTQLLEANKSIENLTIENLKLKEHNEKLENDNDLMKTGNTEMQTKLDENENKIREDSETIDNLTTSKVELEENIKTLNSDKSELENRLEILNTEMLSNKNEFESEKEALQEKLNNCDTELCNLKSDHQSLLAIKDDIQEKFDEQTSSFDDLKNKFSGLELEHARSLKDIENIQIQLNNSESGLKDNLSKANESETVIKELRDNCEALEKANNDLQSKLETMRYPWQKLVCLS